MLVDCSLSLDKPGDCMIKEKLERRRWKTHTHFCCLMQEWLKHTGSPASKIEKCEFGEEQDLPKATYQSFEVLRGTRA